MAEFPVVEAELTFLTKEEGGRSIAFPPGALNTNKYRPHIVLGDINQRETVVEIVDGKQQLMERYLGVAFCDGPHDIPFGRPISVKMTLMYYPQLSYVEVIPGETFTLREGGRIVGYGTIKARYMQDFPSKG